MLAVAIALGLFDLVSAFLPLAKRGWGVGGRTKAPPVYARLRPDFDEIAVFAIVLAVGAGYGAWWLLRRARLRPVVVVGAAFALLFSFSAAVTIVDGRTIAFVEPIKRRQPPDYQFDVIFVRGFGVREFVERHDEILKATGSIHTQTHPPGPVVLLSALESVSRDHLVPRALVLAFLSSLIVVPAWVIARRLAGERAANVAVLLLAVAPSPVMFVFLSMDAVYGTMMAGAIALLVVAFGSGRDRPALAALAGGTVGLLTFFTYAASFVAAFGVLYAFLSRPARGAIRGLALAAGGGVAALVVLRVAVGFDLLASYGASFDKILSYRSSRPYLYWIFGNPAAWLTFAGLPIAALLLRELFSRRPRYVIAMLLPLAAFYLLPESVTRIIPGETERTLLFTYPLAAAAAGAAFVRWEEQRERRDPRLLGLFVGAAAFQTIFLEVLFTSFW